MVEENRSSGFWQTIPGMIAAFAGIITAIAGLLVALYQIGVLGTKSPPENFDRPTNGSTPTAGSNTAAEDEKPSQALSGRWHDQYGTVYDMTRVGDHFTGTSHGAGFTSRITGTVTGQDYVSTFITDRGSSGDCNGRVSANGTRIDSTCRDTAVGTFSTTMYRDQ